MAKHPTLIGIPYDASSSFLRGSASAPPLVRQALYSPAGNRWAERLVDAIDPSVLRDAGDLDLPPDERARTLVERAIRDIAAAGGMPIAVGGDHSITYPILRGLTSTTGPVTILHVDAHPDLYDEFEGDRFSHACPFARVLEEGLARRLVQVGIRTMTRHQHEQAVRFRIEQIDMRAWDRGARPLLDRRDGAVYISLDLDGLDPAFAPGVSHREPGGLSVRDVLSVIDGLDVHLAGADIVEFNPSQDPSGLTAFVAAKFVKELSAKMLADGPA
jgi:agmatinase